MPSRLAMTLSIRRKTSFTRCLDSDDDDEDDNDDDDDDGDDDGDGDAWSSLKQWVSKETRLFDSVSVFFK
jgi:hypothetical protein